MAELPSLSQLQEKQEKWLKDCQDDILMGQTVVRELGKDYDMGHGRIVRIFSQGDIHFIRRELDVRYLPREKDGLVKTAFVVTIGEKQGVEALLNRRAVVYAFYNYPKYGEAENNFAVPGKWQEVVSDNYDIALKIVNDKHDDSIDKEREELARRLWIID